MTDILGATPAPVPATEDWAFRRVSAWGNLVAYWRTGSERRLAWFVDVCGEGGTFESDFWFETDLRHHVNGLPSLYPMCWHCWQRKPHASFLLSRAERTAREEDIRQRRTVEPLWHGHSAYCQSCRVERADDDVNYNWRRTPSDRVLVNSIVSVVIRENKQRICARLGCEETFMPKADNHRYCSKECRRHDVNAKHYQKRTRNEQFKTTA